MNWRWGIAQWFELRWWKRYLKDKSKDEYLQWKRKYWERILALLSFEIKPNDRIADLGCGPAGIFVALPEHHVTAVDPLLDKYEAETSFFKRNDYPQVRFVQSSIEDFSANEKFDVVFCMNVINHVQHIDKAMDSMTSICGKKGHLVISIDAHNYSFFKYLFRILPADILHPYQYDLKGYKKLLQKNGWKVSVPYLLKQGLFFNHYMLVCRK